MPVSPLIATVIPLRVMREYSMPYGSWRTPGTPLNKMLHCGSRYNFWVAHAIKYLPEDVSVQVVHRLAIFSTAEHDACRVARAICEEREIILLSERILPKKGAREDQPQVRYFIFVVLHEIAHAYKKHRSPLYDGLSQEEVDAQEKEADDLAFAWFNMHVQARNNPHLHPLTYQEIKIAQGKNQQLMNRLYRGV